MFPSGVSRLDRVSVKRALEGSQLFISRTVMDFGARRMRQSDKLMLMPSEPASLKVNNDVLDHIVNISLNNTEIIVLSLVSNGVVMYDLDEKSSYGLEDIQSLSVEKSAKDDKGQCACNSCKMERGEKVEQPNMGDLSLDEPDEQNSPGGVASKLFRPNFKIMFNGQDPEDEDDADLDDEPGVDYDQEFD